jgi:hypothetical protein
MVCAARNKRLFLFLLSAILLISLLASSAFIGDPGSYLTIDNRTDITLSIFIDELPTIDVPPQEKERFGTIIIHPNPDFSDDHKYLIEAKTKDGEVVYSEEFTWQELDDMDWKIVITSPATS